MGCFEPEFRKLGNLRSAVFKGLQFFQDFQFFKDLQFFQNRRMESDPIPTYGQCFFLLPEVEFLLLGIGER